MKNKPLLTTCFAYIIIFNPLYGSLIGNRLMKWVGDYKTRKAMVTLFFMQLLACICFTPAPYMEKWYMWFVFCSLYQITGMAVQPCLVNVMNGGVPKAYLKKAKDVTTIASQFLGGLPAPPLYGIIAEYKNEYDKHYAMKCCMWYLWTSMIPLGIAMIIRLNRDEKNDPLLAEGPAKPEKVSPYDENLPKYTTVEKSKDDSAIELKEEI